MRKLAVIAVTGLGICAVCLASAAVVEAPHWGQKDWDSLRTAFGGLDSCKPVPGATATTRELAWTSDEDKMTISLPGEAHYQPGTGNAVTATGDPSLLAHLRIHEHTIDLDCEGGSRLGKLDVTLPGRTFRSFTVAGSGKMDLKNIEQPSLNLTIAGSGTIGVGAKIDRLKAKIAGSGTIVATGQAEDVDLTIAGSGDARLGELAAKRADINIAGSGNAEVAPTDSAKIKIAGSGDVRLVTEPKDLDTKIFGSGRIMRGPSGKEITKGKGKDSDDDDDDDN
ncbi:MAG TPA: head GIN domain-containing protein [Rhizomicrobium sp.]|jgi:hypothetical protein|nr:head GIN domain-containing protein [Rhizomicrobium sp.]